VEECVHTSKVLSRGDDLATVPLLLLVGFNSPRLNINGLWGERARPRSARAVHQNYGQHKYLIVLLREELIELVETQESSFSSNCEAERHTAPHLGSSAKRQEKRGEEAPTLNGGQIGELAEGLDADHLRSSISEKLSCTTSSTTVVSRQEAKPRLANRMFHIP
jgi:hypothetical protein